MRKFLHILFALFAVGFLTGFGFAADAASQGFDIGAWFVDAASLAVVVVAVVAFLREHVLKNLAGIAVVIVSLGVGAGLGAVGALLGYVEGGIAAGLMFGVSAGFIASGGVDALTGILGKRKEPAALPAGLEE